MVDAKKSWKGILQPGINSFERELNMIKNNFETRKKTKVLTFPAGSIVGLEHHNFFSWSNDIDIIGGTSLRDHSMYVYDNIIENIPFVDVGNFIEEFNRTISKNKIDFVIPTTDKTALYLSKFVSTGQIRDAEILVSPYETCRIAYSKKETYKFLSGVVPTPKVYNDLDEIETFPVFLKPESGTGAINTHTAASRNELESILLLNPELMVLEFLPGTEYTVECFTNQNGKLEFSQSRKKSRFIHSRFVAHSDKVERYELSELAARINSKLKFSGPWFCQFKEDRDGNFVLLEIASRIAAGSTQVWLYGVNLFEMMIREKQGKGISFSENEYKIGSDRTIWYFRYKAHFDFDRVFWCAHNFLFLETGINHRLIELLYKFQVMGKTITLITERSTNPKNPIRQQLKKSMIPFSFFESIQEVEGSNDLLSKIIGNNSLLISSSLDERNLIKRETAVTVLDVNEAIELFLS